MAKTNPASAIKRVASNPVSYVKCCPKYPMATMPWFLKKSRPYRVLPSPTVFYRCIVLKKMKKGEILKRL